MPSAVVNNKNNLYLKGMIISPFVFYFALADKTFYRAFIEVISICGISNKLPIVIDEKDLKKIDIGTAVKINANIRTRNYQENGIKKVDVYAFAYDIKQNTKIGKYANKVLLEGYICEPLKIRYSPTGDKLYLTILANNRKNGVTNYVPIVLFEKNNKEIPPISVGDLIQVTGRFQSRIYWKDKSVRTVYEVAVSTFSKL